jgi:arylsulfatase A-like enzyme
MGDAFYRWDGFKYYASFSEFLPSVGLAAILWSMVSVFAALLIWFLSRISERFLNAVGLKIRIEHLLVFICLFVLLGAIVWTGKELKLSYLTRLFQLKIKFISGVSVVAIILTWLFRGKAESWVNAVQERITPLVWIFGLFVIFSVAVVAYSTWWKGTVNIVSQKHNATYKVDNNMPNILLVTFDALTARDMSVYGYKIPTTPFINEWAKTASLYTMAEAESNITTPTTASLMTGKRLWTHQTYHLSGSKPLRHSTENLPFLLKKRGYYNMAFIVNSFASVETLGIDGSFDIAPMVSNFSQPSSLFGVIDVFLYDIFGNKIKLYDWVIKRDFILFEILNALSRNYPKTEAPPEKAFNKFLEVIDNNHYKPFFAWIHILPPHDPYLPPEPYMGKFDSSLELRTKKDQDMAFVGKAKHQFGGSSSVVRHRLRDMLRARYNEFVLYCDKQFADLIEQLKARKKLKDTVIILSSDHGESFEHELLRHGSVHLYEQLTHIPLIIKEPYYNEGVVINDVVEQIDIPATILELAMIKVPTWMEGRSLVPLMRGKKLPQRPALSLALEKQSSRGQQIIRGTVAVWEGDYKLVHYLTQKKSLLFNLKKDPHELINLINKESEISRHLLTLIHDNLEMANKRISNGR